MSMRGANPGSESTAVVSATLDDLDLDAIAEWLKANAPRLAVDDVTTEDALMRVRLAASMGTRLHPTLAGLYVFGHEPQFAMPQLGVVAAQFDGSDVTSEIVARGAITGPLPALVADTMSFIAEHARELVNQVDPSQSSAEFPRRAVHEAVVNALVHRDLRAGAPVAVRIYTDRLEIWSPGPANGLPEPIHYYARAGGISLPRNPLVAVLARQLGLADQLGRGLALMRRVVEDEAHAEVAIEGTKEGVLVRIPSTLAVRASQSDVLAN